MADEHLRIRDIPGYDRGQQPPPAPAYAPQPARQSPETSIYVKYTRSLWVFASTSLVFLNILAGFMTIRDMFNTSYNPYNHYFMTSAFALTIGILAIVHTHILKKD